MATFKAGEELTAEALNDVVAPVIRATEGGRKEDRRARREILKSAAGFRFGFQLSMRLGVLEYRRGVVELGPGEYLSVGEEEWNVAGEYDGEGYVVLSVYPEAKTAAVEVRKSPVAGGGREFLLGVIKPADGASESYYLCQTDGGLLSVCAPRGVRGWVRPGEVRPGEDDKEHSYGVFDVPRHEFSMGEWHNHARDEYGRLIGGCFYGFYDMESGVEIGEALDGRGRVVRNVARLTFRTE